MVFWHEELVERSWGVLQQIKKRFEFILIGGWATYLYTKALKSRDIDIIVDYPVLSQLGKELPLRKNQRLRRYEVVVNEVEIDVYVPYFSDLGIPVEEVMKSVVVVEGFRVPKPEILLILKQKAEMERAGSLKGLKDRIDILALLVYSPIDWKNYVHLTEKYDLIHYRKRLQRLIEESEREFRELNIVNPREIKKIKRGILEKL